MDTEIKVLDERTAAPPPELPDGKPSWWKKLKSIKHFEFIIAGVLCAVLLLVYAGISSGNSDKGVSGEPDSFIQQLENTLSKIEGVGKVSVMITYKQGADGTESKEVEGVIVVAQGGANPEVKFKLIQAIQIALNVDTNKIKIYSMK